MIEIISSIALLVLGIIVLIKSSVYIVSLLSEMARYLHFSWQKNGIIQKRGIGFVGNLYCFFD